MVITFGTMWTMMIWMFVSLLILGAVIKYVKPTLKTGATEMVKKQDCEGKKLSR